MRSGRRKKDEGVLVAGVDVGTQGVRAVVLDRGGGVRGRAARRFDPPGGSPDSVGANDPAAPDAWWTAVRECLRAATSSVDRERVLGVSVASTSGTVVLLDSRDRPLGPALPYNEEGAAREAAHLSDATGMPVAPTAPAARLLRLRGRDPRRFGRVRRLVHAADFVVWKLTGRWVSDWSHALKTGFDPVSGQWSRVLDAVGLGPGCLPRVVRPASAIGTVRGAAAGLCGLSRKTVVFAGMTDGCASQIATGAVFPGEWCTTIGTTLVLKGVSTRRLEDPGRGIYSHRHPDGFWMPGGASNTGGGCLETDFPGRDPGALEDRAAEMLPTRLLAYPLRLPGERFPFVAPAARGFLEGTPRCEEERFAALLEGVAFVERLAYATLAGLGAELVGPIASAGGGSRSSLWMRIRSDVLGRPVRRAALPEAAAGAAILAATGLTGRPLGACAREMVTREGELEPRPSQVRLYHERYDVFVTELRRRGYLDGRDPAPEPERSAEGFHAA